MKPITWIPLIWGVVCGAASSGHYVWNLENVLIAAACMLLSGPLMTGYTQTLNDFYDREIDAINEPYSPDPLGGDFYFSSHHPNLGITDCGDRDRPTDSIDGRVMLSPLLPRSPRSVRF